MAKHNIMQYTNYLNVFSAIRKNGPVEKREIQSQTGLSWGSISKITNHLLELGILTQSDNPISRSGRPAKELDINPDKNLIIGLDINLQGITGVIINMKGHTKHILKEPIFSATRLPLMQQIKKIIRLLLHELDHPEELLGIGISFPGHINQEKGISVRIQQFPGFDGYAICDDLKKEFGYDVKLGHDTNCIALFEQMLGSAQDLDNFLLLRLDLGIGMATVYDGQIFTGHSGATGEIGHVIMQAGGPLCQCGRHGCLETYASIRSIIQQCSEGLSMGLTPQLASLIPSGSVPSLASIMEAVQLKDPYCSMIIDRAAAYTAIAIANVVNILDPDTIVLCGELTSYPDYLEKVVNSVQKNIWRYEPVSFRTTKHHHGVSAAVGIASQFINPAFSSLISIPDPALTDSTL